MSIKAFLLILICNIIVACSSFRLYENVVTTEFKTLTIPEEYLEVCELPTPPVEDEYINQNWVNKEILLTNYSIELIKSHGECGNKLLAIRKLQEDFRRMRNEVE